MSLWLFKRLSEKARFFRDHRKCGRCGIYYRKELEICNICSALTDEQLAEATGKRKLFRMTLGKGMLLAALFILVLMIALASW